MLTSVNGEAFQSIFLERTLYRIPYHFRQWKLLAKESAELRVKNLILKFKSSFWNLNTEISGGSYNYVIVPKKLQTVNRIRIHFTFKTQSYRIRFGNAKWFSGFWSNRDPFIRCALALRNKILHVHFDHFRLDQPY